MLEKPARSARLRGLHQRTGNDPKDDPRGNRSGSGPGDGWPADDRISLKVPPYSAHRIDAGQPRIGVAIRDVGSLINYVVSDLLIQFCYLLLVEFPLKFGSLLRQCQRLLEEFLQFLAELPGASSLGLGHLDPLRIRCARHFCCSISFNSSAS